MHGSASSQIQLQNRVPVFNELVPATDLTDDHTLSSFNRWHQLALSFVSARKQASLNTLTQPIRCSCWCGASWQSVQKHSKLLQELINLHKGQSSGWRWHSACHGTEANASDCSLLVMSSLLWRDKPVTIHPIKHWKSARRVRAVALTPHVWSRRLLVSFALFFGAYRVHGPLLLSLNHSLTMLAFTLGTGLTWTAAFVLLVVVNVPCHDDVTAEGVYL